jgi:hypothetical protein
MPTIRATLNAYSESIEYKLIPKDKTLYLCKNETSVILYKYEDSAELKDLFTWQAEGGIITKEGIIKCIIVNSNPLQEIKNLILEKNNLKIRLITDFTKIIEHVEIFMS